MPSLDEWLAYQAQVHPQSIDLGLERSRGVLQRLGWTQPTVPVITVAGTNGKGSVTADCAAVLTAAGYRVGTFTSPHLRDYRERIQIHGRWATEEELVQAFERIEQARGDISLTYFEYNTLAAFLILEAARLDAWVLEVGLGGRLDAVNIVDPWVAVVVSVGLDHQEYLGNTRDAIAREKAGIFRKGRRAVFGSRDMPPTLMETALRLGAVPKRPGIEFDYMLHGSQWSYRGSLWELADLPPPALSGGIQIVNAATALAALEELDVALPVSAAAVATGLRAVRLTGRFQVITGAAGQPTWILDVAHNPDAARALAENLKSLPTQGKTFAVCGILADKDAPGIAAEVRDCFAAWWLASTDGARGTSATTLAERIRGEVSAPLAIADSVAAALNAAAATADERDRIVIFGSFHTVGPALDWLEARHLMPRSERAEPVDAY